MNDYAMQRMKNNQNPNREEYSLISNNCGTFAAEVLEQDNEVKRKAPTIIDPRPNSIVKEFQDVFKTIIYTPQEEVIEMK